MGEVSRRSFMQSMSAAMAAVVVGRLPASEARTVIDYSRFCDYETVRYNLESPWSHDGVTYASDSRILISHAGEFSGTGEGRFPDVGSLAWDSLDCRGWKPFPMIQRRIDEAGKRHTERRCPECRGLGRIGPDVRECLKCDGLYDEYEGPDGLPGGSYLDLNGRRHTVNNLCPHCTTGSTGGILCGYCDGTGESFMACEQVGGLLFDGWYADSIRTLPEPEYRVIEHDFSGDKVSILGLRFGAENGRGFLMPLVRD